MPDNGDRPRRSPSRTDNPLVRAIGRIPATVQRKLLVTLALIEVLLVLDAAGHRVRLHAGHAGGLTAREVGVLVLLSRGMTKKQILLGDGRLAVGVANHDPALETGSPSAGTGSGRQATP